MTFERNDIRYNDGPGIQIGGIPFPTRVAVRGNHIGYATRNDAGGTVAQPVAGRNKGRACSCPPQPASRSRTTSSAPTREAGSSWTPAAPAWSSGATASAATPPPSAPGSERQPVPAQRRGRIGAAVTVENNTITEASLFDIAGHGIDLVDGVGANDNIHPPTGSYAVLTATNLAVSGATAPEDAAAGTATPPLTIDVYASTACDDRFDREGRRWLGRVAANGTSFAGSVPAPPAGYNRITFTTTDADGDTSELSGCLAVTPAPVLAAGDVSLTESNAGSRVAYVPLTLSRPSPAPVTVSYATASDTATQPGDYDAKTGTATIPAGSLSTTVAVVVKNDTVDETNEKLRVNLSSAGGATIGDPTGVVTIVVDDASTGRSLTIGDVTLTEGHAGTMTARLTVDLSKASTDTVKVDFATADASATELSDYTPGAGRITFLAGTVQRTVDVTLSADTAVEAQEQLKVVLSNPSGGGAVIADNTGTITIRNDD